MKKSQFTYSRKEQLPLIVGETEQKFVEFIDSFNIKSILRSRGLENGTRMIILTDLHERWTSTPILGKNGKIASYKREKDTFQSEILLNEIDSKRFLEMLSIIE